MDQLPQGTRCLVGAPIQNEYEVYVQTSKNSDKPVWELIGTQKKKQ